MLSIPHFQLTESEQKELVGHINKTKKSLEIYYSPYFTDVKRARAARAMKNYENDLLPIMTSGADKVESRPNTCMPWVKAVANSISGELYKAIFFQDFLAFDPSDELDSDLAEDLARAFDTVREETRTDEKEEEIIESLIYDGTVPCVIKNDGRINTVHEIIPTYEVDIPEEARQLIIQAYTQDALNTTLAETPDIVKGELAQSLKLDPGSKLTIKQEDIEIEGETFVGIRILSDSGLELKRFTDDTESGSKALNQAFDMLNGLGIDSRKARITEQQVKTTEKWIEGYPRPQVLDILRTYPVPPDEDDNPDTYKFITFGFEKTQALIDSPNYINKDKLRGGDGQPIGKTSLTLDSNDDKKKKTQDSYTASEKCVEVKTAFFNHFRFESGKELRNFVATTAEDTHLIECRPNVFYMQTALGKISKSPLILLTYNKMVNENIGTTVIHDLLDLAKAANILVNYALDSLSRNGNIWAAAEFVDLKTENGGSSVILTIDSAEMQARGMNDIRHAFAKIEASNNEAAAAFESVTLFRDQIHSVANASPMPFMQSNPQNTATQSAILSQQANAIIEKLIKHVCRSLCEIYSRMLEDMINRGLKVNNVPYNDNDTKKTKFKTFDFGDLKGKTFTPKITNVSSYLNKQIKGALMEKVLTTILGSQNPEVAARVNISEAVQEWFRSNDIDNSSIVRGDMEAQQQLEKIDMKEQLYAAVTSGQYTLIPVPQPGGVARNSDVNIQQSPNMGLS